MILQNFKEIRLINIQHKVYLESLAIFQFLCKKVYFLDDPSSQKIFNTRFRSKIKNIDSNRPQKEQINLKVKYVKICAENYNKLDLLNQIQSQLMSEKIVEQIKERIEQEGTIEQIVQLNLEELRIPSISNDIKKVLQKAKNLQILILADNHLQNVDNLPKLDLTVLDLSSNKVTENALKRISDFTDLGQLILAGNEIKTLQGLKPLFKLKKLLDLDLSENPVAELLGYRELLFKQIPSLQILDHSDKEGKLILQDSGQDASGSDFDQDQEENEDEDQNSGQNNNK